VVLTKRRLPPKPAKSWLSEKVMPVVGRR